MRSTQVDDIFHEEADAGGKILIGSKLVHTREVRIHVILRLRAVDMLANRCEQLAKRLQVFDLRIVYLSDKTLHALVHYPLG